MPFDIPQIPTTEEDSTRNGFLSHRAEWHAITIGIAVGFASFSPVPRTREFVYRVVGLVDENGDLDSRTRAIKEAKSESWYAAGGVVIGALFALAFLVLATLGVIAAPETFDGRIVDVVETLLG